MNYLDYIKKKTILSIDTADINFIKYFKINNVTTNPTLILKVIKNGIYKKLLNNYLKQYTINHKHIVKNNLINIIYMIIAKEILSNISGDLSIEINPNYCFNIKKSIYEVNKILYFFNNNNINIKKILIKIPASWQGLKIAGILQKQKINCNLTLIFSLLQAKIAADKGIYIISPFVGRIYDWYFNNKLIKTPYNLNLDPGIKIVKNIIKEYKFYKYKTIIMAASFRNINQIISLYKCNRITISPDLLLILLKNIFINFNKNNNFKLLNKFKHFNNYNILSKNNFLNNFCKNYMVINKFNEGINLFKKDYQKLYDNFKL